MATGYSKYSLIFDADASQAKREINDLVKSLREIQAVPNNFVNIGNLTEAKKAVQDLQNVIRTTTDKTTGQLDLSRFAEGLSKTGRSLSDYERQLSSIGPAGNAAFKQVAMSINNAQTSTIKLTKGMQDFITTMKNTVKWQISSSIMHGLIGAVETAYGYAQRLDKSLNDIRIVSGASSDEMARFAVEANRAAQALSTTTSKYTEASLIFYQQNLGEAEIKKRTEAVIKMANVTGDASAEVSSYMTAIWNNYQKAGQSAEYFGDVITKLGADTAASSAEIANGLQKFSAVGDQIGLSFEYAASALTTIVAQTRESEDVVGTALKTIFARIQGLTLGETLDDGTDLNKYSNALLKVGIDIKDTSGQIKDMDTILDELGAKWQTLGKDTQIALAQTVSGVRQYTQLVALMDNWDFFQQNLQSAYGATGTLTAQSEIYAEGWEAARNRVQSALEGIYDSLLDEQVFIQFEDFLTGALNLVNGLVKGAGGLIPILSSIAGLVTIKMAREVPYALSGLMSNISVLSGGADKKAQKLQEENTDLIRRNSYTARDNTTDRVEYQTLERVSIMKEKLLGVQGKLSAAEIRSYEAQIQQEIAIGEILKERAREYDILVKTAKLNERMVSFEAAKKTGTKSYEQAVKNIKMEEEDRKRLEQLENDETNLPKLRDEERKKELEKNKYRKANKTALQEQADKELQERERLRIDQERQAILSKYTPAIRAENRRLIEQQQERVNKYAEDLGSAQSVRNQVSNLSKREQGKNQTRKNYVDELTEDLKKIEVTVPNSANRTKEAIKQIFYELEYAGDDIDKKFEILKNILDENGENIFLKNIEEDLKEIETGAGSAKAELIKLGADETAVEHNFEARKDASFEGTGLNEQPKVPDPPNQKDNIEVTTELTRAVGSLMEVYSAFTGIANGVSVVFDDQATAMERIGGGVTALVSAISGLNGVITGFNAISQISKAISNSKANAYLKEAVAAKTATMATGGFSKALLGLVASNPIGWIIGLVAGIGALTAAIVLASKKTDDYTARIEKLDGKIKLLSKSKENLEQKINNISSAYDNYLELSEVLDKCTYATDEWNSALNQSNQALLSILQLAPELGKFVQFNENTGEYSFKAGAYEEWQLDNQNKINTVNNALSYSSLEKEILSNEKQYERFEREYKILYDYLKKNGPISGAYLYSKEDNILEYLGINSKEFQEELKQYSNWNQDTISYTNLSYESFFNYEKYLNSKDGLKKRQELFISQILDNFNIEYNNDNTSLINNEFSDTVESKINELRGLSFQQINSMLEEYLDYTQEEITSLTVDERNLAMENLATVLVAGNKDILKSLVKNTEDNISQYYSNAQKIIQEGNMSNIGLGNAGVSVKEQIKEVEGKYSKSYGSFSNAFKISSIEAQQINYNKLFEDAITPLGVNDKSIVNLLAYANSSNYKDIVTGESLGSIAEQILADVLYEARKYEIGYSKEQAATDAAIYKELALEETGVKQISEKIYDLESYFGKGMTDYETILNSKFGSQIQEAFGIIQEADGSFSYFDKDGVRQKLDSDAEFAELVNRYWDQEQENAKANWDSSASATRFGEYAEVVEGNNISAQESDILSQALDNIIPYINDDQVGSVKELFNVILSGADSTSEAVTAFSALTSFIKNSPEELSIGTLISLLQEYGIEINKNDVQIEGLISTLNSLSDTLNTVDGSFNTLVKRLTSIKDVLTGLETGDTISEEDYQDLLTSAPAEMREKLTSQFVKDVDGWKFLGDEEFVQNTISEMRRQAFKDERSKRETVNSAGQAILNGRELEVDEDTGTLTMKSGQVGLDLIGTNLDLAKQLFDQFFQEDLDNYGGEAFLKGWGYDSEGQFVKYNNQTGEIVKTATAEETAILQQLLDALLGVQRGDYEQGSIEAQQMALSTATSRQDLIESTGRGDIIVNDDNITEDQYNATYNLMAKSDAAKFGIDEETFNATRDAIEAQNKALVEHGEASKISSTALDDLAIAQARLNRGIDKANDNIEDWIKNLKSSDKTSTKFIDTISEIEDVYEDILDLDPDSLSNGFISSAENAELLQKALEGDADAFNELQANAAKDIIVNASLEDDIKSIEDLSPRIQGAIDRLSQVEGYNVGDLITFDDVIFQDLETLFNDVYDSVIAEGGSLAEAFAAANDAINSVGFGLDPSTLETKEVDITSQLPVGFDHTTYNGEYVPLADGSSIPVKDIKYHKTEGGTISYTMTLPVNAAQGTTFRRTSESVGGRRSRRGGGGGGGGSRAPRGETKKPEDKERYHTIQAQLDDISDAYDRITKASDRAFGKSRIKLLDEQIDTLEDLIDTQEEYINQIQAYLQTDTANLSQVSQFAGITLQFDENGVITNFDALQDAMWDMWNSHIGSDGNVTGMNDEQWEDFQEQWEQMMAYVTQYEETLETLEDAQADLQDHVNERLDLLLERVTYQIDLKIEVDDDKLEIISFMLSQIENDAYDAAEAMALLGQQVSTIEDQISSNRLGIQGILTNHINNGNIRLTEEDIEGFLNGNAEAIAKIQSMQDEFTEAEIEAMQSYMQNLISLNQSLIDTRNQVYETVINAFNQFDEDLTSIIEKMEHLTEITQQYSNIIDLVGQQNLGLTNEDMANFYTAQFVQADNNLKASKDRMETIERELEEARAARQAAMEQGLNEDVEHWDEIIAEMEGTLMEAESDFMSSWEAALEAAHAQFEASVEMAVQTFNEAVAGAAQSLDWLQESMDMMNRERELYLEDYEKVYELSKLNRDLQNSIDDIDNISGKQELLALQEEINALEADGVQMSEYELENLRRRYELKLAELALTESQNAKSEVRMSRSADGEWSYVYTADTDAVAEAEQNYEDKLYAMQQANGEYINQLQNELVQAQVDYSEAMRTIMMDETLTQEERANRIAQLQEHYSTLFNYYYSQLEIGLNNNQILYEQDWANYSALTGYKISADEDYIDNFNETIYSMLTGYTTVQEAQTALNNAIGSPETSGLLFELNDAYTTWQQNVSIAMDSAGTSMTDFADDFAEDVSQMTNESNTLQESVSEMSETIVGEFDELTTAVENWATQYSAQIDSIIQQNTALAESFNQIMQAWTEYQDLPEEEEEPETPATPEEPETPATPPSAPEEEEFKDGDTVWLSDDARTTAGEKIASGYRGEDDKYPMLIYRRRKRGKGDRGNNLPDDAWYIYNKKKPGSNIFAVIQDKYFNKFDTGGYTGSWGAEGRLAMLHEKEIVLNKDDTKNFLAGIEMLRQVASVIDMNAYASAGYGMSAFSAGTVQTNGQTLQQQVHITAEFPNATDRNEIAMAFNDIVNLASQYANRT